MLRSYGERKQTTFKVDNFTDQFINLILVLDAFDELCGLAIMSVAGPGMNSL